MTKQTNTAIEVSGSDLANLVNVSYDEAACLDIANMAARRLAANVNRAAGMSWGAARKAAAITKATAEQQAIVTNILMRGFTPEQAVREVLEAA